MPDRLAALEQPFRLPSTSAAGERYAERLQVLRLALPPLPAEPQALDAAETQSLLEHRAGALGAALAEAYTGERDALIRQALQVRHSYEILFAYSHLLDALHRCAFQTALDELPLLLRVRRLQTERELAVRSEGLPRRAERLQALLTQLESPPDADENLAERAYMEQVAREQRVDLSATQAQVAHLQAAAPALEALDVQPEPFARRIVLFARGGYGRAEMSFSSDVDTGYALDARALGPGQTELYHDFVLRIEHLLQLAGADPAHQFFELDEDLSRFAEPDSLHTIPSILESRTLAGNGAVLSELQAQFRAMLPFEPFVRRKVAEFEEQERPDFTAMDLKEDQGGLRSIQTPLWLLGIAHEGTDFSTVGLLRLGRERGLLSVGDSARLLLALEILYELRNFVGAAQEHYYDREARESGFHIHEFRSNRLHDALARLYLFRKQRFPSMDAFDSYRLQRLHDVQRISRELMARVLDRTLVHELEHFHVSVHLGQRCILGIEAATGRGAGAAALPVPLEQLCDEAEPLLELFAYIAASGYDLTPALKDRLGDVVMRLQLPTERAGKARQAALLSELMGAPAAHRAMETLFEIGDPLAPGQPSLIGRFIPAFDEAIFLLRRFEGQTLPLHVLQLRSLAYGARELATLRRHHPELSALLQPRDVLALNWSLLLQGLGRLPGSPQRTAVTAERAAEVLAALGYDDGELERSVRLLVEHHLSLAALSRTATYQDQALAQFFEIAGRSLVNATLLYLVNVSVLEAHGESSDVDVASLRTLFREAQEMLGEMRGFPVQERSLELINVYFKRKKEELLTDTRLHLLLQSAIARGLKDAVFEPLQRAAPAVWEQMQGAAGELEALQREIVLGAVSPAEQARLETRLLLALRHRLGRDVVLALTAGHEERLSWFFAGFPNRYLMGSLPGHLAAQLAKFSHFRQAPVIVDVVPGAHGLSEGLLIYIRGLTRPHTRVAYALSRNRVNIGSGKVNRIELSGGEHAFCYYFQGSTLDPDGLLVARDLELMIAGESPPELAFPRRTTQFERTGVRVEFQGNDGKGYRVVPADGRFEREDAPYAHLRVVLRDEPHLFYKVSRAFDLFDVEVQQSLITTIGNQVVDYFYLQWEDYDRLRASNFEEVLINLMHSDLLAVAP